jgi:A/G-specific adenine glycosylase
VRRRVLRWTQTRERPLPWRGEKDAYRILVSEVMLQQTQAARVVPHYQRFLERFPTVAALAESGVGDVLRAWENLGYNRRALNLWRTAQAVVERGGFPSTVRELQLLPGLGPYTARAVASFAFGADVGVVDANVRRVITRLSGRAPDDDVQDIADRLVPRGRGRAGEWNQAMIDLGAEVCRARAPRCDRCPLLSMCAWSNGVRPERRPRGPVARFEDTTRYARGAVVRALRQADGLAPTDLQRRSGLDDQRLADALATLQADGLIGLRRGKIFLGALSARESADARRR